MKVTIRGWFTGESAEEEVDDLQAWIEKHAGAVIVYPPSIVPDKTWMIYTTDKTNRFNQR